MPLRDSLKKTKIDTLDFKTHLGLLGGPLLMLFICWGVFFSLPYDQDSILKLALVCIIYVIGYSLSYYLHQGRLNRLWQHLQHVVHINDTIFELVNFSSQYKDEKAFLNALLKKAVSSISGAEMGSIIRVEPETGALQFESTVGIDIEKLGLINFNLKQSFEYLLTEGRCDRVVVIDDMANINSGSSLTEEEQIALLTAPKAPILSTLSSPIHIEGKLYAMLNLDSSATQAFSDYDRNLVATLTNEAANALALYQKSRQVQILANYDSLTGLYNRMRFEELVSQWQVKPHFGSYLILIDLDNLKIINDNSGHQAGDDALQAVAARLKSQWHRRQLVARYGGDEFIAMCHGPLERIIADIETMQQALLSEQPNIHFSYGISEFKGNWNQSFKQADGGMYKNKRAKKRRVS